MATITTEGKRRIIRSLLEDGGNHRAAVFEEINRDFLQYAMSLLGRAADGKIRGEEVRSDNWYFSELVNRASQTNEVAVLGGVPKKTIFNIYGSATRQIVLEAAAENINSLNSALEELRAVHHPDLHVSISLGSELEFTTQESMLLINALAVKRHQISGGKWAAVGIAVEAPLMLTLCRLFALEPQHYRSGLSKDGRHQVDFMLQRSGVEYRCEVKLNGRGNPESVTAAIARDPRLVLADFISEQNREKLDAAGIRWVDFHDRQGYLRFGRALDAFNLPYHPPDEALPQLNNIFDEILPLP